MSIVKEPWFKNGLAEYKARELAIKLFWRAVNKQRKRDRRVRKIGLKAVQRALA